MKKSLKNRRPTQIKSFDQFDIAISHDPKTNRVCEVFIVGRGKEGSPLSDTLYEAGCWISETIQNHDEDIVC